jgi:hypothetical protein
MRILAVYFDLVCTIAYPKPAVLAVTETLDSWTHPLASQHAVQHWHSTGAFAPSQSADNRITL